MRARSTRPSRRPDRPRPYVPSDTSGNLENMMVDMLLNEIQTHISRIEDEQEKRRQESLKANRQPDYGWLMDWKLKTKKNLSKCSAVELMCQKIRPAEWGALIREWRQRVQFVESRDEVVNCFRAVVDDLVNERCASRNSVRFVDELLNSDDPANWHARPHTAAARLSRTAVGPRSQSIAELSPANLSALPSADPHDLV
ncbi:hypothetical protein M3Y99_00561600 [Aphelenchoides fujianensis]|nr:hypothetical protein M3Y99_00561600 [Aphelenchoides fujianensis]